MTTATRTIRLAMLALSAVLSACSRTTVQFRPARVWHVADGSDVRFKLGDSLIAGKALGWQTGRLRLIRYQRDTVGVPQDARVEVLLADKKRHTNAGAAVGYIVAALTMISDCGFETTCGEQDPRPLLGIVLGALVGAVIETDNWARVLWRDP